MKKNYKAISGIFPMPVLMIATFNEDKTVDCMNAAWSMAVSMKQIKICMSSTHKTYKNLKRNPYCTISLATKDLVKESDYFGIVSGNTFKNKFENSHLTFIKSSNIDAPIINEYPITMECSLVAFEDDGVVLDVLNILVEDKYLKDDNSIDFSKVGIISYNPYDNNYYEVKDIVGKAFTDGKKLIK